MADKDSLIELVEKAQLGDKGCLNRLAKLARERLRAYVYRLTLDDDLTEDVLQESMLEMFKFLDKLKRADRFWPWLRRIAANKVYDHYNREHRRRTVSMSEIGPKGRRKDGDERVADLIGQELKQTVFTAMHQLRPRHRHILVLRCYEEMRFSEIAKEMGCSEFGARRLFYRAKRSLAKQLSHCGLGKGTLLTALVLFGKMTAPSEAAAAQVSVTAAATKVGVAAGVVAMLGSKTTVVCLATAGVLGVGTLVATSGPDKTAAVPGERPAGNSHVTRPVSQVSKVAEEYRYFFPEGTDGAMMTRLMKGDSKGKHYYCQWMQDEEANYYFDKRRNIVHINDYRQWHSHLSVWRLPTDKAEIGEFLSQVEGEFEDMEHVSGDRAGLMVVVKRKGNGSSVWTTRHYQVLNEEYFVYSWPADAKVTDNRDAMHIRGWTYFRITGQINGERVSGMGRLPFVYAACGANRPWLRLGVRNRLRIIDTGSEALVCDGRGRVMASYAGGSFFKGLTRPWIGLHTIDTVRRDAAEKRLWFETKYEPKEEKAEVQLTCEQGKLVYTIDMQKDVIDKVTFSMNDGREGELRFSYLQDIGGAESEFVEPRISRSYGSKRRASPGMLWLVQLAEGNLIR